MVLWSRASPSTFMRVAVVNSGPQSICFSAHSISPPWVPFGATAAVSSGGFLCRVQGPHRNTPGFRDPEPGRGAEIPTKCPLGVGISHPSALSARGCFPFSISLNKHRTAGLWWCGEEAGESL